MGRSVPASSREAARSWRTIRDSRSRLFGDDREAAVGPLRVELLRVRADARQRRLQVVADATQEIVLRRVELLEPPGLGLDLGEQLGVADGDRDLAREELEEVLIGDVPAARGGQVPDEDAEALVG